ncbi:hypothetical protein LCGC14_2930650 [marine sediment metagenome]|uniref:Spore protein YkvP/CgeB glycosyl transferase-like domain-containing protein n=1 Tax=marine sediment metagenome TaxID=412755 RepID=A0A0F8XKZ5_9ZZZZ|nr:glycosyltransferase family 1 protein [Bacteroides sp.]
MKILFIGSRKYDYLADLTYSGLIKVLGPENMIELKWNPRYHIPYKTYPKNIPTSRKGIFNPLLTNKKKYDVVLVAAAKPDCFQAYLSIVSDIPADKPVVFIDGGDREEFGGDLERMGHPGLYEQSISLRPFDKIFKREFLKNTSYPENVYPLPLSVNYDRIPALRVQKKYQVAFWAVEGHPIRTRVLEMLEDRFDCRENGTHRNQEFKKYKRKGKFYLQELAACTIGLSFRGGGWDTLRYWEIPAVGSFMISQPLNIVIPDDFRSGEEIVFCKEDASDLIDLCTYYLNNSEKRENITARGAAYAREYHSDEARARYIMKILTKTDN